MLKVGNKSKIMGFLLAAFLLLAFALTHLSTKPAAKADILPPVDTGSRLLDENGNVLGYHRLTGMLMSSTGGFIYDSDSMPIYYHAETNTYNNSQSVALTLLENSLTGNYYLMKGSYKVRTVGFSDALYIITIKAHTLGNASENYDILATAVWVENKQSWLDSIWAFLSGSVTNQNKGYYEYYNLYGHKIDSSYIVSFPDSPLGDFVFRMGAYYGTFEEFFEEIIIEDELSESGNYARHPVTNDILRDDRGQRIRIADNGQLVDPLRYALIGADARPLYYDAAFDAFVTHSGEVMTFGENATLEDLDGYVAHSVITDLLNGRRLYWVYLVDGVTLMPATGVTLSTNPFRVRFYDLNGKMLDASEIIEPEVSEEDRRKHYPDEFAGDSSFWLSQIFDLLTSFFGGVGTFVADNFLLIILLILILPALIGAVLSFGLEKIFNAVFNFFASLFKMLAKLFKYILLGIWQVLSAPIKLVQGLKKR